MPLEYVRLWTLRVLELLLKVVGPEEYRKRQSFIKVIYTDDLALLKSPEQVEERFWTESSGLFDLDEVIAVVERERFRARRSLDSDDGAS